MRYILVRHVETQGNVERRFNGHTESPYTKRGLKMKAVLIKELEALHEKWPITHIYASPILRARTIGEALSKRIQIPLVVEDDLKEFNFGIFDGLTAEEAMKRDPQAWKRWMANYNFETLPQGENYRDYHRRMGDFIKNHPMAEDETTVIIAHGGTVHSLLLNLLSAFKPFRH